MFVRLRRKFLAQWMKSWCIWFFIACIGMSCQAIDGDEEYTSVIRDVWVEDIEYLDTSMLQGRSAGREQLAPGHDPAVLKVLPPISPGARHEKNGLIARARYNTLNEDLPASFDAGNNSATLATVVWCEDLGECQIWADANNYCAVPVECSEATEWTCVFRNKDTCADIVYSGYIGGTGGDYTHAVAVDRDGAAYVSGETTSDETSFPVTVGPRLTMDGDNNVFVGKVRPDGTGMVYLGYIGGDGYTTKWGSHEVGVDGSGAFVVSGHTYSSAASFPHKIGPFDYRGGTISNGTFIAKVSPSGADLAYAGWMPIHGT